MYAQQQEIPILFGKGVRGQQGQPLEPLDPVHQHLLADVQAFCHLLCAQVLPVVKGLKQLGKAVYLHQADRPFIQLPPEENAQRHQGEAPEQVKGQQAIDDKADNRLSAQPGKGR